MTSPPEVQAAPSSEGEPPKYHALVIDSGAIIKQTSLSSAHSLLQSAEHYYTVPAVVNEIRDAKSRKHFDEFQLRLESLRNRKVETRMPSQVGLAAMSDFARKTGDYPQLSGVDLQVLALLYDLEVEAAGIYNDGDIGHVRKVPKRMLGVSVKALSGDGRRGVKVRGRDRGESVSSSSSATTSDKAVSNTAFFRGDADGIISASNVDLDYDEDEGSRAAASVGVSAARPKTWAVLVNPDKASSAPLISYSLAASSKPEEEVKSPDEAPAVLDLDATNPATVAAAAAEGQFDDASESEGDEGAITSGDDDDGELDAINIANGTSDDEISDEECDVFILEPHEAAYFKKLKEEKAQKELVAQMERQTVQEEGPNNTEWLNSDFPSLAAAADVPYEPSDGEDESEDLITEQQWLQREEERKITALQQMVNGRVVQSNRMPQSSYNSFRKYQGVVSAKGSAVAMQKQTELAKLEEDETTKESKISEITGPQQKSNTELGETSRFLGSAAATANDMLSKMSSEDDDGEGWVTCTRDIQTMKATGSLHLDPGSHSNDKKGFKAPREVVGLPISERAVCATTDFAMQNVILQMNLELLSVDGVRVRRLKTWVTRCGACFTIYGSNDSNGSGRLFCDKCGSNVLQRIAASVDRNTGRLKLHMRKNYQYNTRGTKFSLPKPGSGNKYEGDLLLAEDQLHYGAWNQKLRKGKSKTSGQSIFGSDLASDLGCHTGQARE